MIGAELNAAVQEEWPAEATHLHQLRTWVVSRAGRTDSGGSS
jgi:membrane protein